MTYNTACALLDNANLLDLLHLITPYRKSAKVYQGMATKPPPSLSLPCTQPRTYGDYERCQWNRNSAGQSDRVTLLLKIILFGVARTAGIA